GFLVQNRSGLLIQNRGSLLIRVDQLLATGRVVNEVVSFDDRSPKHDMSAVDAGIDDGNPGSFAGCQRVGFLEVDDHSGLLVDIGGGGYGRVIPLRSAI